MLQRLTFQFHNQNLQQFNLQKILPKDIKDRIKSGTERKILCNISAAIEGGVLYYSKSTLGLEKLSIPYKKISMSFFFSLFEIILTKAKINF